MRNFMTILSLGLLSLFLFADAAFADAISDSISDAISVPEPASMSLFAVGAASLVVAWKRKQKK